LAVPTLPCFAFAFLSLLPRPQPPAPLFPYTTLFRSSSSPPCPSRHLARRFLRGTRRLHLSERQDDDRRRLMDAAVERCRERDIRDRKSTRLNSNHVKISYAVFCLKKKK